METFNFLIFFL